MVKRTISQRSYSPRLPLLVCVPVVVVPASEVVVELYLGGFHCVNFCRVYIYLPRTAIIRALPTARLIIRGRSATSMKATKDSLKGGIRRQRIVIRGRIHDINLPAR